MIYAYIESHPDSARELAKYVVERGIGSTVDEGNHAIQWYEEIVSPLKSGSL